MSVPALWKTLTPFLSIVFATLAVGVLLGAGTRVILAAVGINQFVGFVASMGYLHYASDV